MPAGITSIKFVPGSGALSNWLPTSVSGCTLWLDPTSNFVNNTSWKDRISGLNFSYSASGGATATSGTSINGNTTVDLALGSVGGSFRSSIALNQVFTGSPNTSWTCLTVFRYTGSIADDGNHGSRNPSIINDGNGADWWQGVSTSLFRSGLWVTTESDDSVSMSTNTNYYMISRFTDTGGNGGSGPMQISVNGGAFDTGTTSITTASPGAHTLVLGISPQSGIYYAGSFGDIVIWNSALSSADIANAQNWAHRRYGI